jgi:hypothetical protein
VQRLYIGYLYFQWFSIGKVKHETTNSQRLNDKLTSGTLASAGKKSKDLIQEIQDSWKHIFD